MEAPFSGTVVNKPDYPHAARSEHDMCIACGATSGATLAPANDTGLASRAVHRVGEERAVRIREECGTRGVRSDAVDRADAPAGIWREA
jgi:hypothetical protein